MIINCNKELYIRTAATIRGNNSDNFSQYNANFENERNHIISVSGTIRRTSKKTQTKLYSESFTDKKLPVRYINSPIVASTII